MARSTQKSPAPLPRKVLTADQIERGIARLDERIADLRAFNVVIVPEGTSPELTALSVAIRDTLDRCFGEGTAAFQRFEEATELNAHFPMHTSSYPQLQHYQKYAGINIASSVALLQEAQRTLREDLADAEHSPAPAVPIKSAKPSNKVFVVHGHDDAAKHELARFLERIDLEAIILHEQPNQGRTIIEKIEAYSDVGFAVVLLTPDDYGGKAGKPAKPRARQNVVLELGYFVGHLGRGHVCALMRGEIEVPSDWSGVVYQPMDAGGGWKGALAKELSVLGYDIDWSKVVQ